MNDQSNEIIPTPPTKEERNWAVVLHLSVLAGIFIPWGGFIIPFGIWLIKKQDSSFIDRQGREVINFLITVTIAGLVGAILSIILVGFAILALLVVAVFLLTILSAIKVSDGEDYRYPFILRLIR
jgi:uncharacterized Tic20 family protein